MAFIGCPITNLRKISLTAVGVLLTKKFSQVRFNLSQCKYINGYYQKRFFVERIDEQSPKKDSGALNKFLIALQTTNEIRN